MPTHRVASASPEGPEARLLELLGTNPFAPPSLREAMEQSAAGPEVVRALAQRGELDETDSPVNGMGARDPSIAAIKTPDLRRLAF